MRLTRSAPGWPTVALLATAGLAVQQGLAGTWSRGPDAETPHTSFGIGLREMLADEITADLRAIRAGSDLQGKERAIKP